MRVRMLVGLSTVSLVVVVVGLVVALATASSDPTRSASVAVDVGAQPVGGVQAVVVAPPGADGGTARVFVVREAHGFVAFAGRSTASTECALTWVQDPDRSALADSPRVEFEDPCGGAFYTLDGSCIAGPCRRGLDHYAIRVTGTRVTVDLSDLVPGSPRV